MMWGYYNGYYGGGWPVIGVLVQVLVAVIIISVIFRIFRGRGGRCGRGRCWHMGGTDAEETLRDRFAKGEISKEEYEEKIKVLRQ